MVAPPRRRSAEWIEDLAKPALREHDEPPVHLLANLGHTRFAGMDRPRRVALVVEQRCGQGNALDPRRSDVLGNSTCELHQTTQRGPIEEVGHVPGRLYRRSSLGRILNRVLHRMLVPARVRQQTQAIHTGRQLTHTARHIGHVLQRRSPSARARAGRWESAELRRGGARRANCVSVCTDPQLVATVIDVGRAASGMAPRSLTGCSTTLPGLEEHAAGLVSHRGNPGEAVWIASRPPRSLRSGAGAGYGVRHG
jgi:hypothetical protein